MNSYLSEFLSYFFPDLILPGWMQAFMGFMCLILFFKVLMAAIGKK